MLVGLDCGSTSVKAVLFGADGTTIAIGTRPDTRLSDIRVGGHACPVTGLERHEPTSPFEPL